MRKEFSKIAFADPWQASSRLEALLVDAAPGLAQNLADALAECAAPDTALLRLERFLERTLNTRATLALMAEAARFARLLATILDQSQFLTDIVCRNPEYVSWLWQEAELEGVRPRAVVTAELVGQTRTLDTFPARCRVIRRFRRRELLRIAARDVFGHAAVPSITEDLTCLADATLEAALEAARCVLEPRYGTPRLGAAPEQPSTFCILALGKLGGRELNFSSDIDLVFLYAGEGKTTGGTSVSVSNAEYFQKLGETIIKALAEHTAEGQAFRVDMRLRPYGTAGPLAVALESAVGYYESVGLPWERQALIKCRAAAGDAALGQRFVDRTRPFVYPRYFDDETLEAIRDVKRQAETETAAHGHTETEVKLGRGGIRDIEFTVQMLQLLNGGRFPHLQCVNTLEAIAALGEWGLIPPLQASALARNYTFLRRTEHRLQLEGAQQRHTLPEDPPLLDAFARRLGYADGRSFMADYRDRAYETRTILERFLTTKGAGALWITDLVNPLSTGRPGLERLAAMGFADPEKARRGLLLLANGPPEALHSAHVRQHFIEVAPVLLETLSAASDPDAALLRLEQVLEQLRAPAAVYDILRANPQFCRHLVSLVANSRYLTEMLIREPALFETFGSEQALEEARARPELEEELAQLRQAHHGEAALYRLRAGETLRIGMRELLVNATVVSVGQELTCLAEVCLDCIVGRAHARAAERWGPAPGRLAVLGLGKFGGRELNYGSDLDVLFVYEPCLPAGSKTDPAEYFAEVASHTIKLLKEPTRYGALYEVDTRLRPDGNKGMLAISAERFERYFKEEAQSWERLALMKGRAVAGDPEFGAALDQMAKTISFGRRLTPADASRVEDIRRRLVDAASPLELKKADGGLITIELAVRLLQLRYAAQIPEVIRGDVLGAIDALAVNHAIDADTFGTLTMAYLLLRRIENRIRMMDGRPHSALPSDPGERADLAKRMGIECDLAELTAEHKERVRKVYNRILQDVGSGSG